jgi:hypothetical protein
MGADDSAFQLSKSKLKSAQVSFVRLYLQCHIGFTSGTLKQSQKRMPKMIEATSNPSARSAMNRAHEERAQAMRDAWNWLFHATAR